MSLLYFAAAVLQTPANPAPAPQTAISAPAEDAALRSRIEAAAKALNSRNPADAVKTHDSVIMDFEARYAKTDVTLYAAPNGALSLAYMLKAAAENQSAKVIDEDWGDAFFLKGFALIDLNRADEAKSYFDRAIALSPMNSQYLSERGEWYKTRKDWANAFADFADASENAALAPGSMRKKYKSRALRGMAYTRLEQRNFKDAEKYIREALKIDPQDEHSQKELEYLKSIRR